MPILHSSGIRLTNVGDARERTALTPIIQEGVAEQILANALDDQPLGLRRPRWTCETDIAAFGSGLKFTG
jgi:hypothetical protein